MNRNKEGRVSFSEQYIGSPDPQGTHRNLKLEKAKALSYFHPDITTMHEVKQALLPFINKEGSFLIRMSITQKNVLTVSVTHQRTIKHFKIQQKCDQYYLQDKCFDSVEDLVEYYRNCDVPNIEQVKGVRLIHPIEYSGYTRLHFVEDCRRRSSSSNLAASREDSQPPPPRASTVLCGKDITASSAVTPTGTKSSYKPQRPPIPLPEEPTQDNPSNGIYNGVYYSRVKQENFLPELIDQLSMDSSNSETQCECGLDLNVCQLPQGWSVHICHDQNTLYGCPFFMDSSNITSWTLPDEVHLELNHNQKTLIKLLNDNFNETKQPPDKKKIQEWMSVLRREGSDASTFGSRQSFVRASQGDHGASGAE